MWSGRRRTDRVWSKNSNNVAQDGSKANSKLDKSALSNQKHPLRERLKGWRRFSFPWKKARSSNATRGYASPFRPLSFITEQQCNFPVDCPYLWWRWSFETDFVCGVIDVDDCREWNRTGCRCRTDPPWRGAEQRAAGASCQGEYQWFGGQSSHRRCDFRCASDAHSGWRCAEPGGGRRAWRQHSAVAPGTAAAGGSAGAAAESEHHSDSTDR